LSPHAARTAAAAIANALKLFMVSLRQLDPPLITALRRLRRRRFMESASG